MTIKLNHAQAYLLGSIARWSDQYRRELDSLNYSVQQGLKGGVRHGINIGAADKVHFASQTVEHLLDQLEEMFDENVKHEQISQLASYAMKPTEMGLRRRFHDGDELDF